MEGIWGVETVYDLPDSLKSSNGWSVLGDFYHFKATKCKESIKTNLYYNQFMNPFIIPLKTH